MIGRTFANLGRLRQITSVIARHGLAGYVDGRKRKKDGQPLVLDTSDLPASVRALTPAKRFRRVLEELGPTFIKFGQLLSTRADLIPQSFVDELSSLQDDCSPMSEDEVRQAMAEGLGRPLEEVFSDFTLQPVASASIAQVHAAITTDGQKVAVKVQRLGVQDSIYRDLDLLGYLASLLEAIVEESGIVTPRAVVDEFESVILGELDFHKEARITQRFWENAQKPGRTYIVPKVFFELSSRTVLTMEFIDGIRLNELKDPERRKRVAENVIQGAFQQLFEDGLFHADPHPGNAFVLEDDRLAMIDFGATGQISVAMRETLVAVAVAIGTKDADTVARLLYRVGIPDERISLRRMKDAIADLLEENLQLSLGEVEASRILRQLFDLAGNFGIRIPSEYIMMARAGITIEGVMRELDPELNVFESTRPHITKLVEESFDISNLGEAAVKGLFRTQGMIRELPLTASQILMDLEMGKLTIRVESPAMDAIAKNIEALGIGIFFSVIAGGLIAGGLFVLRDYRLEVGGLPVVPAIAFFSAALLIGGAVGRYLIAPRFKRLSLARLFSRRRK
ncbi:AarF/ABC1/UbiB kinase family protein [Myxococcota bacterium]|nr:AarF/ABC1/UbiB kinase family protein [Myxococcota bacterium]